MTSWQTFLLFFKGVLESENMNLFTSAVGNALLYLQLCNAIKINDKDVVL